MCGIVGIAEREGISEARFKELTSAVELLKHRGPDNKGSWIARSKNVGFAHRRLSVLDLSSDSSQPMTNESGTVALVFNGEIYNFSSLREELRNAGFAFNSLGDTEVILRGYEAWGTNIFRRLVGAFAIAIFDERTQRLHLARDRAGEKPLFYSIEQGKIAFASESGPLSQLTREKHISHLALDAYLHTGFGLVDRGLIRGISKVKPGSVLTISLDSFEVIDVHSYWVIPDESIGETNVDDLCEKLEFVLSRAVISQLVSDVPLGILLSGGIDSSLLVALAARSSKDLKTYTIKFSNHEDYDESRYARVVADHFDTDHNEFDASELQPELLLGIAQSLDQPVGDSSILPTFVVSQLVKDSCTVALGGDGGDELFGGYFHYSRLERLAGAKLPPHSLRSPAVAIATRALPTGKRGRNWVQALGWDYDGPLGNIGWLFTPQERVRLVSSLVKLERRAEAVRFESQHKEGGLLYRAMRMDFENYLVEDILVKTDRASMLNSLELRAPFLDRDVLNFAFGEVPTSLKANRFERKILLRELARRILPAHLDLDRKQGFSIPLHSWLLAKSKWRAMFEEVLLDDGQQLFNHHEVQKLFRGIDRGRRNSERLFALFMVAVWIEQNGIRITENEDRSS